MENNNGTFKLPIRRCWRESMRGGDCICLREGCPHHPVELRFELDIIVQHRIYLCFSLESIVIAAILTACWSSLSQSPYVYNLCAEHVQNCKISAIEMFPVERHSQKLNVCI